MISYLLAQAVDDAGERKPFRGLIIEICGPMEPARNTMRPGHLQRSPTAASPRIVFSAKLPCEPARATAESLASAWTQTITTDSRWRD